LEDLRLPPHVGKLENHEKDDEVLRRLFLLLLSCGWPAYKYTTIVSVFVFKEPQNAEFFEINGLDFPSYWTSYMCLQETHLS
jgi:hypothetical protein